MSKDDNGDKDENKFGVPQKEEIYEKYENEYYIVNPLGTNSKYVGKIKNIDVKKGRITFNPYFGLEYNRESGKDLYALIKNDYDLFTELNKLSFEPTTKNSIVHNCYLGNQSDTDKPESFYNRLKLACKILFNKK